MYFLDNSALQGIATAELLRAAANAPLCVPEILFYELLTTAEPRRRAMLFRKVSALREHLHFAGSIGHLLRMEDERRRPSRLVADAEGDLPSWPFIQQLQIEEAAIPQPIRNVVEEWTEKLRAEVRGFRQRAISLMTIFPELGTVNPQCAPAAIETLRHRLGGDSEVVREVVWHLQDESQRRAGTGPEWIGYRMTQAQLVWTLESLAAHGTAEGIEQRNNLENTICDIEYATLASQCSLFLTRDEPLTRLFGAMQSGVPVLRDVP